MFKSVEEHIFINIRKAGKGTLFFIESFITYGNPEAVKKRQGSDRESDHYIQKNNAKEKPTRLQHDIRLAPVWIREIMSPVLKINTITHG